MYEDDVLRFALRAAAEAKARLTAKYPKRPRMGWDFIKIHVLKRIFSYLEFDKNRTIYQTIADGSGEEPSKIEVNRLTIDLDEKAANIDPIE